MSGRTKAQVRAEGRLVRLLQRLEEYRVWNLDELSSLCEELEALGNEDWPADASLRGATGLGAPHAPGQDLWAKLGQHLSKFPEAQQQRIVLALAPLRHEVCKKMLVATDVLNTWLSDAIAGARETQNSLEEAVALVAHLQTIDDTPQLRRYKECGDLGVKTCFLMAMGAVVRAAQDAALLRPCLAGHPPALVLSQRIASIFFTLPGYGNALLRWHDARLDHYGVVWRLAAERAVELFRPELEHCLVAALLRHSRSGGSDVTLRLSPWPMAGCPLAEAFLSFVGERASELDVVSLRKCPVHSLRPATLLRLLRALTGAFDVVSSQGHPQLELIRLRPASVTQSLTTPAKQNLVTTTTLGIAMPASTQPATLTAPATVTATATTPATLATPSPAPAPATRPATPAMPSSSSATPSTATPSTATTASSTPVNLSASAVSSGGLLAGLSSPPVETSTAKASEHSAVQGSSNAACAAASPPVASASASGPGRPKLLGFGATSLAAPRRPPGRGKGALQPKLVRRSIDWKDAKFLERLVRRGLAAGDEGWTAAWHELCTQREVSADFAQQAPPKAVLVQFLEVNLYRTTGKAWARELLYKRQGEEEEAIQVDDPSPSNEAAAEETEASAEGQTEEPDLQVLAVPWFPSREPPQRKPSTVGGQSVDSADAAQEESEQLEEERVEKRDKKDKKKEKKEKKDKKEKKRNREKERDEEAPSDANACPFLGKDAADSSNSSDGIDLEQAAPPSRDHRTRMCFTLLEGRCHKGRDCVHAHSAEDLRKPGEALLDFEKVVRKQQAKRPRAGSAAANASVSMPATRTGPAMPQQHWPPSPMAMGHMMGMSAPHMMDPMMLHSPMDGMMGMPAMMHGVMPQDMMHMLPHLNPHMVMEGSETRRKEDKSKKRKELEREQDKTEKEKSREKAKGKDKHRDNSDEDRTKPKKDKKDKGKPKERKVDDEDL